MWPGLDHKMSWTKMGQMSWTKCLGQRYHAWFSFFRDPLPYLLTTPTVDIKEICRYFNQIIRCSGPNSRLSDLYPLDARWLKWQRIHLPMQEMQAGDTDLIPGSGRSPGGGNDSPLQYSCLESSVDRGAWRATIHRVAKSETQLSRWTHTHA